MKDIIHQLEAQVNKIQLEQLSNHGPAEHGTPEQTRRMLTDSIFVAAASHIQAAINQLRILDRELY